MQLKTILNRVEHCKSFVYSSDRLVEDASGRLTIEVTVEPRSNGRPICSGCQRVRPGYDRLAPRRFEFVPLWAIPVFFVYAMRRVDCPDCGVTVEEVPWGDGKCTLTKSHRWFLAGWAKRLSWKETAEVFGTTWEKVFRAVKHAVLWGLVHREIQGLKAIGVDEIQWRRGHKYLTLVYQIDQGMKRLLWVAKDRTEQSLREFFEILGRPKSAYLKFTCSDMWQPYLNVLREQAQKAIWVSRRAGIPHHGQVQQGLGRGAGRRGPAAGAGRLRAGPQTFPLVPAQAAGKPDRPADGQAVGTSQVQLAVGARLPVARGLSAILGIPLGGLGQKVPGRVVPPGDAFPDHAAEEVGPYVAKTRRLATQLVSRRGDHIIGRCGGL